MAVGRIKGRCSFELSRDGGARGIEGIAREDGGERKRESRAAVHAGERAGEAKGGRSGDAVLGVARMEPTGRRVEGGWRCYDGWRRQRANLIFAPLAMPLPLLPSVSHLPSPYFSFSLSLAIRVFFTHNSCALSMYCLSAYPLYLLAPSSRFDISSFGTCILRG